MARSKVKCHACKEYVDTGSAFRRGLSSWCDYDCFIDSQNAALKKKYKKMASSKGHDTGVYEELRLKVLTSDNFRCRLCAKQNNLAVHHVIYKSDKKNKPWENTVSNLITLCNTPCHLSIVHKNKKRFQRLCLGIIWIREIEGDRSTTIYQLEKRLDEL